MKIAASSSRRLALLLLLSHSQLGTTTSLLDEVHGFLATRTAVRLQSQTALFPSSSSSSSAPSSLDSEAATAASASASAAAAFHHRPDAIVHELTEANFREKVAGAGGPLLGGNGTTWLLHFYSPYDPQSRRVNALLQEELAPLVFLSSPSAAARLHVGRINVVQNPNLAEEFGVGVIDDDDDEQEEHQQQSQYRIHQGLYDHHHHQQQQPTQSYRSALKIVRARRAGGRGVGAAAASATQRGVVLVDDYHGPRNREALMELVEHASSSAAASSSSSSSSFLSMHSFPTPAQLETAHDLVAFRDEHPFVFVLATREDEDDSSSKGKDRRRATKKASPSDDDGEHQQQQSAASISSAAAVQEEVLKLAFVSACEAMEWRHCAVASGRRAVAKLASSLGTEPPRVAKLEEGGESAAVTYPLHQFARRPESLREWMTEHNHPLVAPLPLPLGAPSTIDRLIATGGRLVVAVVDGAPGDKASGGQALIDRLHAIGGHDGGHDDKRAVTRGWLRQHKVRMGYVVRPSAQWSAFLAARLPGPQLPVQLQLQPQGGEQPSRLFVIDGKTRGIYNIEDADAAEAVLRNIVEGRLLPTYPLAHRAAAGGGAAADLLARFPNVARLRRSLCVLVVDVLIACALGLLFALAVLYSPRRWWIREEVEEAAEEGTEAEGRQQAKHGAATAAATGAGGLVDK